MRDKVLCGYCGEPAVLVRSMYRTTMTVILGGEPDELGRPQPILDVLFHCPTCHRDGRVVNLRPDWSPVGTTGPVVCLCGRRARVGHHRPTS